MKKEIQLFDTHADADRATKEYYQNLSTTERLQIFLEMIQPVYEAAPRLQRILRTCDLGECPVSSDWGLDVTNLVGPGDRQ